LVSVSAAPELVACPVRFLIKAVAAHSVEEDHLVFSGVRVPRAGKTGRPGFAGSTMDCDLT